MLSTTNKNGDNQSMVTNGKRDKMKGMMAENDREKESNANEAYSSLKTNFSFY